MATITKIRQQSGLVLIVIGLGMGAFILGDFFRPSGPSRQDQEIGSVKGQGISRVDYESRVNEEVEALRSTNQNPTPEQNEQIRQQVWNTIIQERTVGVEVEKAGFKVTKEEYDDIRWGDNINPVFLNNATFSPNGFFDPSIVKDYFSQINKVYPIYAKVNQIKIIDDQLYSKYFFAISKGLSANDLESIAIAESNDSKIDFNFVLNRYNSIVDSTVVVSDSDVKAFYNKHKKDKEYKQLESRGIKYISFSVEPSESDMLILKNLMDGLLLDFKNTDNDSLFVINNSDNRQGYFQNYVAGGFKGEEDTLILNAAIGDVVGPFISGDYYNLVKISGDHFVKEARVRHILLRTDGTNDLVVGERADSLIKVIKRKRNFEDMVNEFSDDVASVPDGGVYDWFPEGRMVAEFNDFSFNGKIGAIESVKTTYGYHIVEILGQREERLPQVSIVNKIVEPTNETYNVVYAEATDFSINNGDFESFEAAATEQELTINNAARILKTSKGVPGMANSGELVSWAYSAVKDEVSTPIELNDQMIVAVLVNITEKGIPSYENVEENFKRLVIKEKKIEMAKEQMAGNTDLDALAADLNVQVQIATNIPFTTNNIPGGGSNEAEVIGKAFTLEQVGDVSIPIEGNDGVYVIELTNKKEVAIEDVDPELFADEANSAYLNRVNSGVFSSLRTDAEVEDERTSF